MKALPLILVTFLWTHIITAAGTCHYPNGRQATGDFPCDPDAQDSPCCGGGLGSVCLTNKLCGGPNGNIIRGSCTDESWDSRECAHFCLGANTGGTDLISCTNVTELDTSYCCDHTINCCNSGVGRFNVLPSNPQIWATWNRESSQFVVIRPQTTERSTSTSTPAASTTSSTESEVTSTGAESEKTPIPSSTASSTTPPPLSTGGSDGAQGTPDPSPPVGEAQTDPDLSVAAKAGIGAGAGAGALLIGAIIFLLLKMRKNKKALEAQKTQNNWSPMYQETSGRHGYYNGPPDPWKQQQPTMEGQPHPWEMDGRPVQQHWARVELPANN